MKTIKITELENLVLETLIQNLYAEPGFSDVTVEDISLGTNLTVPVVKGAVGSLTKKNIVTPGDHFDKAFSGILYLNHEFYNLHYAQEWKDAGLNWTTNQMGVEVVKNEPKVTKEPLPEKSVQELLGVDAEALKKENEELKKKILILEGKLELIKQTVGS